MTAEQLALDVGDCEPTWPAPKVSRRRLRSREKHDLRGQGLTRRQLDRITTIRLTGNYL